MSYAVASMLVAYRAEAIFIVPMSIGLFLLGAQLLRAGLFDGDERGKRLRSRLMLLGLGFGVPADLATTFEPYRPWWVIRLWAAICALFMVLATLWLKRFERGPIESAWHWAYRAPQHDRAVNAR